MRTFTISGPCSEEDSQPRITLKASLTDHRGIKCESGGCASENLVISKGHPVVAAAHLAYARHHPLQLSPDDIWLCIAQGFAVHLQLHSERLRDRLVRHSGKLTLTVQRDHFVKGSPQNDWPGCFAEFSELIAKHSGKVRDLVVADFSTTGPVERAASEVVLMSAMQNYFKYEVITFCDIPEFRLSGTADDWRRIRVRAKLLVGFDLDEWVNVLIPVLDEFVSAAEGHPVNRRFWSEFYKRIDSSGGPYISGWINTLFPYLHDSDAGKVVFRFNPWVLWNPESDDRDGPTEGQFPSGLSRAPFVWKYLTHEYAMAFHGGFVGVAQDPITRVVQSAIGWAVSEDTECPPKANKTDTTEPHPSEQS